MLRIGVRAIIILGKDLKCILTRNGGCRLGASDSRSERADAERGEDSAQSDSAPVFFARSSDVWGVAGFGLYLAWFYLIMACSVARGTAIPHGLETHFVFTFLVGEAAAAVVFALSASHLMNRRAIRALSAVSCLLLMLPGIVSLMAATRSWFFAAWFLSGLGSVTLLSLWGLFLAQLAHSRAPKYTALSALLAVALLILARVFFKEDVLPLVSMMLAVLSVMLFVAWERRIRLEGQLVYPEKSRPPDWGALLHSAGAMVANNFLLGFGFYSVAVSASSLGVASVLTGMFAAAVYKVVDARTKLWYQVDKIIKVIAPVAAFCLLLLPFVPFEARCALVFTLVAFAMTHEIICWSAVAEYMHIHQVQPFANMAFGRFGEIVGLLFGFGCAAAIIGPSFEGEVSASALIGIIVIAFVFLQSFFFKDNYTPLVEHKEMDEDIASGQLLGDRERHGSWKRRCYRFAEHYGLTPRQTEVLLLLAKGYSMGSIEEQLVVSIHTVKAHVYGIYQKADIHSRKELFEKISDFEDDGGRGVSVMYSDEDI